jgi:hypothetical protein
MPIREQHEARKVRLDEELRALERVWMSCSGEPVELVQEGKLSVQARGQGKIGTKHRRV